MHASLSRQILVLVQEKHLVAAPEIAESLGATLSGTKTALRQLRKHGLLIQRGDAEHVITSKGSESLTRPDPQSSAEYRRRYRARMRELALPIVQHAQMKSPVSVWAYAARCAA